MEHKHIHWLGNSAFRIEDDMLQIYIDPFKIRENLPKADVIFISHPHFDHFSMEDIDKIRKAETTIVAPGDAASKIGEGTVTVIPDQDYNIRGIKVSTVPAYNIDKKFHLKKNNWVGYILTLSDGQKIYHAGDTDFIPEMNAISTDIALLPCGGTYTMTAREALEAANKIKPKILIPMHFGGGLGSKKEVEEIKLLFKGETVIKAIET
jgi:L-ascorbate metabolism protein UlaG (beta-lactamase superfamily)